MAAPTLSLHHHPSNSCSQASWKQVAVSSVNLHIFLPSHWTSLWTRSDPMWQLVRDNNPFEEAQAKSLCIRLKYKWWELKFSVPQGRNSSLTYCRMSKGAALHTMPNALLPGDVNMLQVAFYLSHSSTQTTSMNKSYVWKKQKLCKSWLTRHKIRQREAVLCCQSQITTALVFRYIHPYSWPKAIHSGSKPRQGQPPNPSPISSSNSILIFYLFIKISPSFWQKYQQPMKRLYCILF